MSEIELTLVKYKANSLPTILPLYPEGIFLSEKKEKKQGNSHAHTQMNKSIISTKKIE